MCVYFVFSVYFVSVSLYLVCRFKYYFIFTEHFFLTELLHTSTSSDFIQFQLRCPFPTALFPHPEPLLPFTVLLFDGVLEVFQRELEALYPLFEEIKTTKLKKCLKFEKCNIFFIFLNTAVAGVAQLWLVTVPGMLPMCWSS